MPQLAALLAPNLLADDPCRHDPLRRRALQGTVACGMAFVLLASTCAPSALAQVARNGPEWGGKDHQPTEAGVIRREDQAGVRPPAAQVRQNKRTVEQLDRQLLHDDPSRRSAAPTRP